MTSPDPVRRAQAQLMLAHRTAKGGAGGDPEAITEARQALTAAKLERRVREALNAEPPLTTEQRNRIASILLGA